jgi:hypothetical protein
MSKEIRIQVDFYFSPVEAHKEERLEKARYVLNEYSHVVSETIKNLPNGTENIIFRAIIPEEVVVFNHFFDRALNKSFPDGAGAGAVTCLPNAFEFE